MAVAKPLVAAFSSPWGITLFPLDYFYLFMYILWQEPGDHAL